MGAKRTRFPLVATCILTVGLAAIPSPAAADNDQIPWFFEALVCGFPDVFFVVNALPPAAGRCAAGDDYASSLLEPVPCAACSQATLVALQDVPLLPAVGLPPQTIPGLGPLTTPPVHQETGSLRTSHAGSFFCVTFTPAGSGPLIQCADLGPLNPVLPNFSSGTFVVQDGGHTFDGTGPTTIDGTPVVTLDLTIGYRWVESRLKQRLAGLVDAWEPVNLLDPAAVQWWADHGNQTTMDLHIVLKSNGAPSGIVDLYVPYAGQAVAALSRSGAL